MAKTGVLSISSNSLRKVIPLKRIYLLFDKLYLSSSTFADAIATLTSENEISPALFSSSEIETISKNSHEHFKKNASSNEIQNNLNFLEAETKFTGREVAYIYNAEQKLK